MAAFQPQSQGSADPASPGLSLSLSSNNPFRNRAGSPLPKSPASPFDDPTPQFQPPPAPAPARPTSNNPFLDPNQHKPASPTTATSASSTEPPPLITMADEKETKPSATTEELFKGLSLTSEEKGKTAKSQSQSPPMTRRPPPRGENVPPGRREPPPPGHRSRGSGPPGPNSPPRRMASGAGRPSRGPDRPLTDEEKKERERKRRDYERKRREAKSSGKAKNHRHADLIDELDESSPLGRVHHGGPYDAIISARNKPTNKHAPIHAFAKDSANMSMGGSGPLNARADHATFMGQQNDEAFIDYGISTAPPSKKDIAMFDPHARVSVIHGDETVGLGTSTFLEGTPAAKAAVEKAEQENATLGLQDGGLQRKKSLAQRIRGINRPPRDYNGSGRMTNPEGVYYRDRPSAGSMTSPRGETNPFFNEYEPSKDGEEQISVVRKQSASGPTSPALPGGLERRATTDALGPESSKPKPTGLIGRMKSLKGGPRSRPAIPAKDLGNAA